jgi:hypothetical protein
MVWPTFADIADRWRRLRGRAVHGNVVEVAPWQAPVGTLGRGPRWTRENVGSIERRGGNYTVGRCSFAGCRPFHVGSCLLEEVFVRISLVAAAETGLAHRGNGVPDIGVCLGLCLAPPANAGVRSERGAVHCVKLKSSSKVGGATSTPSGRVNPSVTCHRRPRCLCQYCATLTGTLPPSQGPFLN